MNEIIAELYDQAIVIEDGGDYVCGELDPEKFAELIIKDQQREWVGLTFDDFPEAEFGNTEFLAGARWAARILKERNT
jgi:hypothetical protein